MRSKLLLSSLIAVAFGVAPLAARADSADHAATPSKADPVAKTLPASASAKASERAFGANAKRPDRPEKTLPEKASSTAGEHAFGAGKTSTSAKPADAPAAPSKADPSAKTLPESASATAKANAFGQKGALQRAAHEAARTAAVTAARQAATAGPPAGVGVPNSHANEKAAGASAATTGLGKASTARDAHAPARSTGRP